MKIKKHEIPLYFGRLDIVVSKDLQKASEKLKVNLGDFKPSNYSAFSYRSRSKKGYGRYMVFIKPGCSPTIIAHEAVHIVNFIFQSALIELDTHNDEPFAYLLGWVVGKIHESVKK